MREAGVSDDAIEDASFVATLFSIYVRLADTLEWDIPPLEGFKDSAKSLLTMGYSLPPPIRWITQMRRG